MAITTGLSVTTLFSPDDDTQQAFLDFVHATKSNLRIAIYRADLFLSKWQEMWDWINAHEATKQGN